MASDAAVKAAREWLLANVRPDPSRGRQLPHIGMLAGGVDAVTGFASLLDSFAAQEREDAMDRFKSWLESNGHRYPGWGLLCDIVDDYAAAIRARKGEGS